MAEKKNIPEIRFKGFDDEWEVCELGELMDITSAARVHKNEWTQEGVPFFRSSDVVSDYNGKENTKAFISFKLYKELSSKIGCVQVNDILVTGGGSIGIPYLVKSDKPLYFKDADLLWLKNSNIINGYFLYTFFSTSAFRSYVNSITHIGTISHYTVNQAKSTPIKIPEKAEQNKVGEYLKSLDKLIALHQRKYDKLVILKKAMLEKMFPKKGANVPEIRFKGFEGKWEERRFDREVDFFSGLTYSPNDVNNEGTFVLRSSNVKNGEIIDADNVYVNPEIVNSINVKVGDIIVVVRNGSRSLIGKHAQIKSAMDNTVIGAFMTGIRSNQSTFINALLDTQQFYSEVEKNLGATINQITNGMFREMQFMFPCIEEQNKIGTYFQNLDNLISLHQRELEKLRNIKKACLEKMFV